MSIAGTVLRSSRSPYETLSKTRPLRLDADGTRIGGRGVSMIAALSDTWGVRDEIDGKTVWAKLADN